MLQPLAQGLGVAQGKEEAHAFDDLPGAAAGGGDQGDAGGHGFQQDHAEGLVVRAQGEDVEGLEVAPGAFHLAEEQHPVGDGQFTGQVL